MDTIVQTSPFLPRYTDKLFLRIVEKAKFDFTQVKLEEEAWMTIINSRQFFTMLTINLPSKKKTSKLLPKFSTLVSLFTNLPQREISKIFQNCFHPWICTSYGISKETTIFIEIRLPSRMLFYISEGSKDLIKITTTMRLFDLKLSSMKWQSMVALFGSPIHLPLTLMLADF